MQKNTKDAVKLMKAGESSLKTGIFKWKPNYLEALPKFLQAATLFENAGDYTNALKCYERLAMCQEKQEELSGAADAYESMGMIFLRHKNDPKTALGLFKKASSMYKIQGNNLKSQDILKKLAKRCFDLGYEDLGADIYKELIEELFDDQDYGTGAEIIPNYQNYLISREKYAESIATYEKHMKYLKIQNKYPYLVERCWLSIVCIYIVMGEYYIADDKMGQFSSDVKSIRSSDEYSAALNLIDALQKKDLDLFAKVLKRPIFTQIEIELLKKLRKFKMSSQEDVKKPTQKPQNEGLFGSAGLPKVDTTSNPQPEAAEVKPAKFQEEDKEIPLIPPVEEKEGAPVEEIQGESQPDKKEENQEEKPEGKAEATNEEQTNDQPKPSSDYGGIFT